MPGISRNAGFQPKPKLPIGILFMSSRHSTCFGLRRPNQFEKKTPALGPQKRWKPRNSSSKRSFEKKNYISRVRSRTGMHKNVMGPGSSPANILQFQTCLEIYNYSWKSLSLSLAGACQPHFNTSKKPEDTIFYPAQGPRIWALHYIEASYHTIIEYFKIW